MVGQMVSLNRLAQHFGIVTAQRVAWAHSQTCRVRCGRCLWWRMVQTFGLDGRGDGQWQHPKAFFDDRDTSRVAAREWLV